MRSDLVLAASAKEKVEHKVNTNLRVFTNQLHSDFPPHWHPDIEIIWPKESPYKVICSTEVYQVDIDDILLICPAVLHEILNYVLLQMYSFWRRNQRELVSSNPPSHLLLSIPDQGIQ